MEIQNLGNMKIFNILFMFMLLVLTCKGQEPSKAKKLTSFGNKIEAEGSLSGEEIAVRYNDLMVADTLKAKFVGIVKEVCQAKGCWMKIELKDDIEAMVRFKDYGFFMPKDIAGKEVIVNGLAFVEEMSVEDQKHYAGDAGKTAEEIARITEPKKTYGFEADGVLLKE